MAHQDFAGNKLQVGDKVAYALAGYVELHRGVIVKLTPKGVRVGADSRATGVFRYSSDVVKL